MRAEPRTANLNCICDRTRQTYCQPTEARNLLRAQLLTVINLSSLSLWSTYPPIYIQTNFTLIMTSRRRLSLKHSINAIQTLSKTSSDGEGLYTTGSMIDRLNTCSVLDTSFIKLMMALKVHLYWLVTGWQDGSNDLDDESTVGTHFSRVFPTTRTTLSSTLQLLNTDNLRFLLLRSFPLFLKSCYGSFGQRTTRSTGRVLQMTNH